MFDKQSELNLKLIEAKDKEFRELCFKIFEQTHDGKRFMELVTELFLLDLPVADPNQNSNYAFWREGTNHLIRAIKGRAAEVKRERAQ